VTRSPTTPRDHAAIRFDAETSQWYITSSDLRAYLREAARAIKDTYPALEQRVLAAVQVGNKRIIITCAVPADNQAEIPGRQATRYRLVATEWSMQFVLQWDESTVNIEEITAILWQCGAAGIGSGRSAGYGQFMLNEMVFNTMQRPPSA
jgi:hypothetical protein